MENNNIIEVNHLSKTFNLEAGFFAKNKNNVYAVNDVSLSIYKGELFSFCDRIACVADHFTDKNIFVGIHPFFNDRKNIFAVDGKISLFCCHIKALPFCECYYLDNRKYNSRERKSQGKISTQFY